MFSPGDIAAITWEKHPAPNNWNPGDLAKLIEPEERVEEGGNRTREWEVHFERDVGGHPGSAEGTPEEDAVWGHRWFAAEEDLIPICVPGQKFPLGKAVTVDLSRRRADLPAEARGTIFEYRGDTGHLVHFPTGVDFSDEEPVRRLQAPVEGNLLWCQTETINPITMEVGDRVQVTNPGDLLQNREPGTIVFFDEEEGFFAVDFDRTSPEFHSCGGRGREGHCMWTTAAQIEVDFSIPEARRERRRAQIGRPTNPFQQGDRVVIPLHVGEEELPPGFQDEMEATVTAINSPTTCTVEFDQNVQGNGPNRRNWDFHITNLALADEEAERERREAQRKKVNCPRLRDQRGLPPL